MDSTSDRLCKSSEGRPGSAWLRTSSDDAMVETQIARDDQQMGFDSDGRGIRVLDEEIDNIMIWDFFNDPYIELSGNGAGLGHGGSTSESKGDQTVKGFLNLQSGKKILKEGMDLRNLEDESVENDDNLGNALSIDDTGSSKRRRKSGIQELGKDDSLPIPPSIDDELKLGFEFDRHTLTDPAVHVDGSNFVGSRPAGEGDKIANLILLSNVVHEVELGLESRTKNSADNRIFDHLADNVALQQRRNIMREYALRKNEYMKGRFREVARENASRFARFAPDEKDDPSSPAAPEVEHQIEDCPPPFSAAVKMIKDRGMKSMQTGCVSSEKNLLASICERNQAHKGARLSVPSLEELCLKILANNADAIVSLDSVPDGLRHRLSQLLCDSRKMNNHFFELLITGSPTEIRLRDCSWLTEEQFTKSFQTCDTANFVVLQLDQCGRCISDYVLLATLTQSPRQLPRLTSLSLSGACRLSDGGLHALVSSTPVLRSINLSQCSLLTSASLYILADSLGALLKELYLDDCQGIDAGLIVPALKELEHLEVLSVAGIQTVGDEFIKDYIIARGHNLKELVLKDCIKLTDASVKVIGEHCPGLCVLDLMNLCKLTDLSIGYLTNSCRALHTLKLCRNPFSDEAIAAFMEITGESLKELSLNNIRKVGHQTTLSLANHAKNLHTLDLSWCRNLTDNELVLIVDSCLSLRLLKLFGCTQVTDVFLGLSNPQIQIIGLQMSPVLQHVKLPDPHQGALHYSSVSVNLV